MIRKHTVQWLCVWDFQHNITSCMRGNLTFTKSVGRASTLNIDESKLKQSPLNMFNTEVWTAPLKSPPMTQSAETIHVTNATHMPDKVFVHIVPNDTCTSHYQEHRIIRINKSLTYKLDMLHSPDLQLSEAQDICLFLH